MIFISILILIVVLSLPSNTRNIAPLWYSRISSIIFIYSGALSLNALYIQSIGSGLGIYSGLFEISILSQIFELLILVLGSLILMSWPKLAILNYTLIPEKIGGEAPTKEYSLIVLISTLGSILLVSTSDLISLYLSIQLQSFGVYILASLYRNSDPAVSAGLKYYLIGGLSSCLILFGCSLIYSYSGLTNLESIQNILSAQSASSNNILWGIYLGIIILIIGLLIKIGAAPLHNWAPDVYDNSPTVVTIWLTIMPKISILVFLIAFHIKLGIITNNIIYSNITDSIIINKDLTIILKNLLLISSLLSLLIGTISGLYQTKIKRLFAYSSISHLGFILLALSLNSEQSIESVIFYIIQYSITNLNIFIIIISLGLFIYPYYLYNFEPRSGGQAIDINFISQFKGIFFCNPIISFCLTISLFSMAGIPPLLGFFAKQFVLSSSLENGYYFMSLLGIIVSIISACYYLKIIKLLHTENIEYSYGGAKRARYNHSLIPNTHSFIISTLTLIILLFVFKPSILLNISTIISLSLFYC